MSEKTTSRERLLELAHLLILNPDDESVLSNLYSELGRINLKKECCSPTDLVPWIVNTLDYHWMLNALDDKRNRLAGIKVRYLHDIPNHFVRRVLIINITSNINYLYFPLKSELARVMENLSDTTVDEIKRKMYEYTVKEYLKEWKLKTNIEVYQLITQNPSLMKREIKALAKKQIDSGADRKSVRQYKTMLLGEIIKTQYDLVKKEKKNE